MMLNLKAKHKQAKIKANFSLPSQTNINAKPPSHASGSGGTSV